jgi:flagellar basal body-associated protein FliL
LRSLRTSRNTTGSYSGGINNKLLLVLTLLVLLAAGGAYVLYGRSAATQDESEATTEDTAGEADPLEPPVVYEVGNFLVNVHTNDELRYLRVEIAASIRDYGPQEEAGGHGGHGGDDDDKLPSLRSEHEALARDAIVRILSASGFAALRTEAGREQAKERIAATLIDTLDGAQVESVLFLSFVMQ